MTTLLRFILSCVLLVLCLSLYAQPRNKPAPSPIPAIDGEAGPCSVELTVTDGKGKPVYNAQIRVQVEYGFLGIRRLDLELGTNADGKARFEGLPEQVGSSLFFRASKGRLEGFASYHPDNGCKARHSIIMVKSRFTGQPAS